MSEQQLPPKPPGVVGVKNDLTKRVAELEAQVAALLTVVNECHHERTTKRQLAQYSRQVASTAVTSYLQNLDAVYVDGTVVTTMHAHPLLVDGCACCAWLQLAHTQPYFGAAYHSLKVLGDKAKHPMVAFYAAGRLALTLVGLMDKAVTDGVTVGVALQAHTRDILAVSHLEVVDKAVLAALVVLCAALS
jgi:hypothetical protein